MPYNRFSFGIFRQALFLRSRQVVVHQAEYMQLVCETLSFPVRMTVRIDFAGTTLTHSSVFSSNIRPDPPTRETVISVSRHK